MQELLVGKFGFAPAEVELLINEDATRAGILDALERLVERTREGEVVFFHFSGHGSRMRDTGDEEIDGWDETLVPHDARTEGVYDISDDELSEILDRLAAKTAHVTFFLDSCHSGTGTRAVARARRVEDDDRPPPARVGRRALTEDGPSDLRPSGAGWVLVAGCRAHEVSNEMWVGDRPHGALSWYFTQSLEHATPETTYRDLMEAVAVRVNAVYPDQNPQIEGSGADTVVFGTGAAIPPPYVLAEPVGGGRWLEIAAGRATGLIVGSVLAVYPPGSSDFTAPPTTEAIVETVEAFRATARVLGAEAEVAPASRAVLRRRAHPDATLPFTTVGLSEESRRALAEAVAPFGGLVATPNPAAARILVRQQPGGLALETADGVLLSPPPPSDEVDPIGRTAKRLAEWARWYDLLELDNPGSQQLIDFEVRRPRSATTAAEGLEARPGEILELQVTNRSAEHLYLTVLDLSTDGSRRVLYPPRGGEERLPPAGRWSRRVRMEVPTDRSEITDFFKVLATTQPVPVRLLEQMPVRSDQPTRRPDDPLLALLSSAATGMSRQGRPVEVDQWSTVTRRVRVRPAPGRLSGYILHLDEDVVDGTRALPSVELCSSTEATTVRPCWNGERISPDGRTLVLAPGGTREVGNASSGWGVAWDEAYRLRRETGAVRVEPQLEMAPDDLQPERREAVRDVGDRPDNPAAAADNLWSLKHAGVPGALALLRASGRADGQEAAGIAIGHPDTGYSRHPEIWSADEILSPVLWSRGYDFVTGTDDALDKLQTDSLLANPGHGTRSGSVIVSPPGKQWNGGEPVSFVNGVAPGARLVPLRVHPSVVHIDSRRLGEAIYHATRPQLGGDGALADVVSISMGGLPSWNLWKAVRYAERRGVPVVAAAGNEVRFVVWPARFDSTIAVAATNVECEPWVASSRGHAVDISAPGESVWSAGVRPDGTYTVEMGQGTTFATATTAGVAALWLAYHTGDPALERLRAEGALTSRLRRLLQQTSWRPDRPGSSPSGTSCERSAEWRPELFGAGIVNATRLLEAGLGSRTPTREVSPQARGFDDLPLFASLFRAGAPLDEVRERFAGLVVGGTDGRTVSDLADLEGEITFHYAVDPSIRDAFDSVIEAGEPLAQDYALARRSLLARDISTRLREQLLAAATSAEPVP